MHRCGKATVNLNKRQMKTGYSILHISDLHKDKGADYDNLLASLITDSDQYSSEGIQKPSIIVVSGDLVEGSKNPNLSESKAEIKRQYDEVSIFLHKLVDYFLDGEREKIVIVPGNHDVCRTISSQSMIKEDVKDEDGIRKKRADMIAGDSRWSWNDLSFYSINDHPLYKSRFELFVDFYNTFFQGIREWEEPCEETAQIIELPEYRICLFALNSCNRLDHLNQVGAIAPTAISSNQRKLNAIHKNGELIIGVWHHHTMGLPYENNYLDYRIIQALIASHVQVGLYGHQHQSTLLNEYRDLTQDGRILLISSGSLYGGRKQLVTGCPRQYCLLSFSFEDQKVHITLHVRKDASTYEIPAWTKGQIGATAETSHTESIPLNPFDTTRILNDIDSNVQISCDYQSGILMMQKFSDVAADSVSVFIDAYLGKVKDYGFLKDFLKEPQNANQFTILWKAAVEAKDREVLTMIAKSPYYSKLKGAIFNYLKEETTKILES